MNFDKHPSKVLTSLFNRKPFQGQSPEQANIIFLSSDANYSPEISEHSFFKYILEYQKDGVIFWNKYNCHHPFLLEDYPFNKNKAGVPFHRNFNKIGLDSEYAEYISFLEILDVPTIGNKSENKSLFNNLISLNHLKYIDNLVLSGGNKLFFISNGVLKDMSRLKKKYGVFDWLDYKPTQKEKYSALINGNKIQEIYHFSSSEIHSQVHEIYKTINNWIKR
jgi:hypothetical protein